MRKILTQYHPYILVGFYTLEDMLTDILEAVFSPVLFWFIHPDPTKKA